MSLFYLLYTFPFEPSPLFILCEQVTKWPNDFSRPKITSHRLFSVFKIAFCRITKTIDKPIQPSIFPQEQEERICTVYTTCLGLKGFYLTNGKLAKFSLWQSLTSLPLSNKLGQNASLLLSSPISLAELLPLALV